MLRKTMTAFVALGLLMAACGDDEPNAGPDSTSAAETTGPAETTAAPDSTSAETTAAAVDEGVTLDEAGRLVPVECTGADNVANEDEGFTADGVNLAALNVDLAPVAQLGFAASDRDLSYISSVFLDEVNDAGGVCGRTIDLQQVLYNPIIADAGPACVQVTQDRANLAAFSANYVDPLCITDAGVPLLVGADITEAEVVEADGLLFSRYPSLEMQYRATVQHALESGALEGVVGVWYGDSQTKLGDAAEEVVLPMLDEAGVDYTAARTDFMGSFDPQGNAVMIAAATGFASRNIDTLLAVTSNVNLVDIQLELAAQGVHPRFISVPIAKNAANELFADAYGTQEVADGMEYVTFTTGSTELDDTNPIAKSCHEVWTRRTGEVVEPNTFDYQIIATLCVTVDEVVAALSLAGAELSREAFARALELLPGHESPPFFGEMDWSPEHRFGPPEFSVQDYDGATNTVSTRSDHFEVAG
jgi:hypothetical protein